MQRDDVSGRSGGDGPDGGSGQAVALFGYVSDPMPTDGVGRLREQMRIVDRIAASAGWTNVRYVVDSGSRRGPDGLGARLRAFIEGVKGVRLRTILVIAGTDHLAGGPEGAAGAIATLLDAGVVLKDASGELHPERDTVALFAAAAASRRQAHPLAQPGARTGDDARETVVSAVATRRDRARRQTAKERSSDAC